MMRLLVSSLKKELNTLLENNVKLTAIGDLANLPAVCQDELQEAIDRTRHNTRLQLNLALSYSGRWEILQAVRKLLNDTERAKISAEQITEELF